MQCPRCQQADLALQANTGKMQCPACGYRLFEDRLDIPPAARLAQPAQAVAVPTQPPIKIALPKRFDLNTIPADSDFERVRIQSRCEEVILALERGQHDAARQALRSVLELAPEFDQAWFFMAGIATTAAEQRDCLERALAYNPKNMLALEALARIDGKLEDAPPAASQNLAPGQVATQAFTCPNCGGRIEYDIGAREVTCHHCGYKILDVNRLARSDEQTALALGLLKRKRQGQPWNIGARWLRCTSCGAITTLSSSTLTNTCRFCGSTHILQESTNLRFEQPDLIVPFAVTQEAAHAAIEKALRSGLRRLTRFFADAITRMDLHGVYLPFWVFDGDMVVHWHWTNAPEKGDQPELLSDVPYLAAEAPTQALAERLEPFEIRAGVDYDPRLLARYPAELYTVDVDRASLDVRRKLQNLATRKARPVLQVRRPAKGYNNDNDPGRLVMHANTQYLSYRLALLPVWVGLLTEEDGDTRPALVNGQTGKVALGKVSKDDGGRG